MQIHIKQKASLAQPSSKQVTTKAFTVNILHVLYDFFKLKPWTGALQAYCIYHVEHFAIAWL